MIRIGKYYYKNFWAFIQVVIFRKPNIEGPKDWEPEPFDPYEGMDDKAIREELLYGNFHEDMWR